MLFYSCKNWILRLEENGKISIQFKRCEFNFFRFISLLPVWMSIVVMCYFVIWNEVDLMETVDRWKTKWFLNSVCLIRSMLCKFANCDILFVRNFNVLFYCSLVSVNQNPNSLKLLATWIESHWNAKWKSYRVTSLL